MAAPLSLSFVTNGHTQLQSTEPSQIGLSPKDASKHSISSRTQAVDLRLSAASDNQGQSAQPIYATDGSIRLFLSQYKDQNQIQLLSSGPMYAGARFAPWAYLSMGYMPTNLLLQTSSHEELLRRSVFPGIHLMASHSDAGTLRITPVALIDPPGRFAESTRHQTQFFRQVIDENLSKRQTEGRLDSAYAKDRILYQLRYDLQIDWFSIGAFYRRASFANTGIAQTPASADSDQESKQFGKPAQSAMSVDHSGLEAGVISESFTFIVAGSRSSGWLTSMATGTNRIEISGIKLSSFVSLTLYNDFRISLFAERSQPDRLPNQYQTLKIGYIDYGASSIDLPLLGTSMLHRIPCVAHTADLCDSTISQNSIPLRQAADYSDVTFSYESESWQVALRGGILVPYRYPTTSVDGSNQRSIYSDFTEAAIELQWLPASFDSRITIGYSVLFDRDDARKRRIMAQSVSASFQVALDFEADKSLNQSNEKSIIKTKNEESK